MAARLTEISGKKKRRPMDRLQRPGSEKTREIYGRISVQYGYTYMREENVYK
jgi:hypothetical protein